MKTIVYLHGFGSSSLSTTPTYLAKNLPQYNVVAPDIPVDPQEALPFLREYCETHRADLVIGTSMGAMYAMQMTDFPRVCINPALHMSQQPEILYPGTFERFQPTADGRTHFTITDAIIRHFADMERHLFDGTAGKNQTACWGFFADGDTLVNCKAEFAAHYPQVFDFHGEHRLNSTVLSEVIIPFVKDLLG